MLMKILKSKEGYLNTTNYALQTNSEGGKCLSIGF
jgi:hypothetical protein